MLAIFNIFIIHLTKAQSAITSTNPADSTQKTAKNKDTTTLNYKVANSELKSAVNYASEDSIVYDAATKEFIFYRKGNIIYDDLHLDADFVRYRVDSSTLMASRLDSVQSDSTLDPNFKQADQEFTFDTLMYNFKSQRAYVEGARTQYGEGYIISVGIKRNNDKTITGKSNIYTTCNLEHPHFGIAASKIKIIPDVAAVSGPAHIVIEDIHTPVYLPFGIFPLKKGQNAGFILPRYGFELNRGFGLSQGGYYIPINQYMDLKLLADIYSLGSWSAGAQLNYNKRYSYNGNFGFNFSKVKSESNGNFLGIEANTFRTDLVHTINPKKLRGATLGADIHIASSNNNRINFYNNVNNIIDNTLTSNISYMKSFGKGRYNFTAALGHTQNNSTRFFNVRLPELNFSANGLTPFANKNGVGAPKWYDKISVNYTAKATNQLDFYDTAFNIRNMDFSTFRNGMVQNLSSSYNSKFLKYINFNVSANYNEFWYSKSTFRYYDPIKGRVDTINDKGFKTSRSFSTSAGFGTNIYGLVTSKRGYVRAIRHVAIPSINFNYSPAFGSGIYNYWYTTALNQNLDPVRLSSFEQGIYGGPTDAENGSIGFNLRNTLEAKVKTKGDSAKAFKKIRLLDNFTFNTSYNIAADSFKWSNLVLNYSSSLFDNRLGINGVTSWDPYGKDFNTGRRTKEFAYETNGKVARLLNTQLNLQTSFRSKEKIASNKSDGNKDEVNRAMEFRPYQYLDFNIPWSVSLRVSAGIQPRFDNEAKRDTMSKELSFTVDGDLSLTEYWKITYNTGYNFVRKEVNVTNISLVRDLHCWTLSLGAIPSGDFRSYTITLQPKSSMLQQAKLSRNKSFWDAR